MLSATNLNHGIIHQTLKDRSCLNGYKAEKKKRPLIAGLMLTSLIDAFVILVIYLLINFGDPQQIQELTDHIRLPEAQTQNSISGGFVVGIKDGHYYVGNQPLSLDQVKTKIRSANLRELVVEGDKHIPYASLNPLILMASQLGLQHFRLAIVPAARSIK